LFKKRVYKIAILISLLVHLLALLVYKPLTGVSNFLSLTKANDMTAQQPNKPLEFELVETPSEAQVDKPPDNAQFLSDKNARAQDMNANKNLGQGLPFSRGQTDYKLFAGGGSAPGQVLPPLQTQPSEEQPQQKEKLEQNDQERFGDVRIFSQQKSPAQSQRFNKNMLSGAGGQNSQSTGNFSDDVNWNNQQSSADDLGGVSLSTYNWDFAPYIIYMKRRIRRHIYPPPAFYQMGAISGQVVLRFRVYPDGSTGDLQLISYKGHKALTETSLNAVKASSPFKKLPDTFPENYLELTWTFIYSIFH